MKPDRQHVNTAQNPVWVPDNHTLGRWDSLQPGTVVTVLKRSAKHDGEDRARYPGLVVESSLPAPWVEIEAHWTSGTIQQAHLMLENDDVLHEIFSPRHPYNAFAVYTPTGKLKGWYANVTYPTLLEGSDEQPVVVWHDLFIDIVATSDGKVVVLDEDELIESGIPATQREVAEGIYAARDHLIHLFQHRQPPFHESDVAEQHGNM